MSTVSTEGRVFVAQLTRDLTAREAAAAGLLAPGHKHWREAFCAFADTIAKAAGPVRASAVFKAGLARLHTAQENDACFVNSHMRRSRSGFFEVLTWEVAKHPLTKEGKEGVLIYGYFCLLQRNGCIRVGRSHLAFCSWHALARMRERSKVDIFESRGVVAGCGFAGLLMRESLKHSNTAIYYATAGTLLCAGTMRDACDDEGLAYAFFDVLTAFQPNEEGPQVKQWAQGCAIADAVQKYVDAETADRKGYIDNIEVLPLRHEDHITRELKRAS